VWQTPLWVGFAGLFVSPGRGLLVHSPILVLGLIGAVRVWRKGGDWFFRAISVGLLGILLPACKWFDWWGGWAFGYRPIVDSAPLLAILAIPVLSGALVAWKKAVLALLLVWSVYVQVLGAFAYDVTGWNARDSQDIDLPQFRARLWSFTDTPILYYSRRFSASRANKRMNEREWLRHPRL
jgi:hypothetical protein